MGTFQRALTNYHSYPTNAPSRLPDGLTSVGVRTAGARVRWKQGMGS